MQLTLSILELPALLAMRRDRLDADARAQALEILARMIAQALETSRQQETADE